MVECSVVFCAICGCCLWWKVVRGCLMWLVEKVYDGCCYYLCGLRM